MSEAGERAAKYCIEKLGIKERNIKEFTKMYCWHDRNLWCINEKVEYIDEEKQEVKLSTDYCPIAEVAKSWKDCPRIGRAYISAILEIFNSNMEFETTERLLKGDPVCSWIFRIKGSKGSEKKEGEGKRK